MVFSQKWMKYSWAVALVLQSFGCAKNPASELSPGIGSWAVEVARQTPAPPAEIRRGPAVFETISKGCSTTIVKGLSEQIIAEINCMVPGSYMRLPPLDNVRLSSAVFPYLRQSATEALVRAAKAAPKRNLKINSMLRTVAQQYLLYRWYKEGRCGITLAARPGRSNHETGLAIDISRPGRWRRHLERHGFRWLGKRDRWHFDYRGPTQDTGKRHLDIEAFQRLHNRNVPDQAIDEDGSFGPATRRALRQAPAKGFPIGATCGAG